MPSHSPISTRQHVIETLVDVLQLPGQSARLRDDTPLLGAVPELDSMAVVSLITALEERFGITIHDEELEASIFDTVGSLTEFVDRKLSARA